MCYTKKVIVNALLNSPNKHHLLALGSTKKLLQHMSSEYGVQIDEISINFPVNSSHEVHM